MSDIIIFIYLLIWISLVTYSVLYLIVEIIPKILKKTILKKYEYHRILKKVKYNLGYNLEMIKLYKGEIDKVSEQYKDDIGICYCFMEWDYPRQLGIDEELLQQGIESEKEALKWNKIYWEKKDKENIQARIKFIEEEMKDIKRRMKC